MMLCDVLAEREAQVAESGRGPSAVGSSSIAAEDWRVWGIAGTGVRPESPGIAGVSRVYRGCIAAVIRL